MGVESGSSAADGSVFWSPFLVFTGGYDEVSILSWL